MNNTIYMNDEELEMTQVINLLGGPGIGKTTTSSLLFGEMKLRGHSVELVREFVKKWAWEGRSVGEYDQVYLFGKQAYAEYNLYGKVDYIVTDSPVLFSPFYEQHFAKNKEDQIIQETAFKFLKKAEKNGVKHHNFLLKRSKKYDPKGRYQTEEKAKEIDFEIIEFMNKYNIPFELIETGDLERIPTILNRLGLNKV